MTTIAVLIPTVNRADRLPSLVENIHQATSVDHRVYLIIETDDRDTVKTAANLDATVVAGRHEGFATAANTGYLASSEPFIAVGNDDVRFHEGWDRNALARMSRTVHIVGINDSSGDCKCFQLIRRAYIKEHSGVYDRPNRLYHEYQSQCPDTELAHYAQLRGVWADAEDAIIEHLHWRLGKASPDDPNYQKARATNQADLELYNQRREQWDPDHLTPECTPIPVAA